MVTQTIIEEYKERMHISHDEDDNLKRLLTSSVAYVKSKCGMFKIEGESDFDIRAKELVFERARYSYNDAVEFFEDNFLSEINSLSLDIVLAGEEDD